jgi:tetratricopeptide (TPR) repeat protein
MEQVSLSKGGPRDGRGRSVVALSTDPANPRAVRLKFDDDTENIVPFLAPETPAERVPGRERLVREGLVPPLLAGDDVALLGEPGLGKTGLATELAHNLDVLSQYPDGVLWAGLGRRPEPLALLGQWCRALRIPDATAARLTHIELRAWAVRTAIGTQRMLIVVDDAWSVDDALLFKVGGRNCAHLVVTTKEEVAVRFVERGQKKGRVQWVEGLALEEALPVLLRHIPRPPNPDEQAAAEQLVKEVKGSPLALSLMAKYLQKSQSVEGGASLTAAFQHLKKIRLLSRPNPAGVPAPSHQDEQLAGLTAAIEVTEAALEPVESRILRALSVFPSKPNTFTDDAAAWVCSPVYGRLADAAPDADTYQSYSRARDVLLELGLLERDGQRRLTMHQVIADLMREKALNRQAGNDLTRVREAMVNYYADFLVRHSRDFERLALEHTNIFAGGELAYELAEQESRHGGDRARAARMRKALVAGVNALYPFHEARGAYAMREALEFMERAERAASHLRDWRGLATVLLNLGRTAEKRGAYSEAEEYLQEAMAVARPLNDPQLTSSVLLALGIVEFNRSNYSAAKQYLMRARSEAGLGGSADPGYHPPPLDKEGQARASRILQRLGDVASVLGEQKTALNHNSVALTYAEQTEDPERVSAIRLNLGVVTTRCGLYREAAEHLAKALRLAEAQQHVERLAAVLHAEAVLALRRGHHEDAERSLRTAMEHARSIGHRWYICTILSDWGELHLGRGDATQAHSAFVEAWETAGAVGSRDQRALAVFGLARVQHANRDVAEAYRLARKSLAALSAIGHYRCAEVERWLRRCKCSPSTRRRPDLRDPLRLQGNAPSPPAGDHHGRRGGGPSIPKIRRGRDDS